ncbi:MAG TPA: hypothetical protein VF399_12010 [bacterium]
MPSNLLSELERIEELARGESFAYDDPADTVLSLAGPLADIEIDQQFGFDTQSSKSPSGTTYGLRIVNGVAGARTVKLFGFEGFKYTDANVTITAQGGYGTYEKFCYSNWFNPAEIVSVRITTTSAQIDQMSLKWVRDSVFGKLDSNVLSMSSYRTESDYQTGVITIPFRFLLAFDAYIETTILVSTTVDLLFFMGARLDPAKKIEAMRSAPQIMSKSGRRPVLSKSGGAV